ncbi:MAG TPA: VanZ family protein, partial [Nocardioidaceae bacterium]|nr:VanZ family protein [Nocardioidaceae bacterium]
MIPAGLLRAVYAGYLAGVGYLVFSPGGGEPGGAIRIALDLLSTIGLGPPVALVEVGLNVLLFLPLSLLGWFVVGPRSVPSWLAIGAGTSAVIELSQLAIPGRVSSFQDVVANTAGAAVGALLARGCVSLSRFRLRDAIHARSLGCRRSTGPSPPPSSALRSHAPRAAC